MINYVDNRAAYFRLLSALEESRWIALDTEFVSERHFQPQLCLVQLAYESGSAILDPFAFPSLQSFWNVMAEGEHETIVHDGRADLEFCLREIDALPKKIFDTQIAAGLIGYEYPAGCANLVSRVLNIELPKTETRTDWTRRPLKESQLVYGLDDVQYLYSMRTIIGGRIEKMGRWQWYEEEIDAWKERMLWQNGPDRWERIALNSTLDRRGLAIARELFFWRERRAKLADCSAKRILRDDLIMDLAKKKSYDIERIKETRDFMQPSYAGILDSISETIKYALNLPKDELPQLKEHEQSCKMTVLAQLLYSALGIICKQKELGLNLVGNQSDIKKWVLWKVRPELNISEPILEKGWRKEAIGSILEDVINGDTVIRVADPTSEDPLEFLKRSPQ